MQPSSLQQECCCKHAMLASSNQFCTGDLTSRGLPCCVCCCVSSRPRGVPSCSSSRLRWICELQQLPLAPGKADLRKLLLRPPETGAEPSGDLNLGLRLSNTDSVLIGRRTSMCFYELMKQERILGAR